MIMEDRGSFGVSLRSAARQPARAFVDVAPGDVEMAVAAIIGIGDRLPFPPRRMVEQQRQPRPAVRRPDRLEIGEILLVERDDMVEPVEIAAASPGAPADARCRRRCAAPRRSRARSAARRHASRRCRPNRPRRRARAAPPPRGTPLRRAASGRYCRGRRTGPGEASHQALLPKRAALLARCKQKHNRGDPMAAIETGKRARAAADPRIGPYAWYALVRPRPGLRHQFHRPADPLDPRRGHQARPPRLTTPRSASSTAPPSRSSTLCSASRSAGSPTAGIAAG